MSEPRPLPDDDAIDGLGCGFLIGVTVACAFLWYGVFRLIMWAMS